ncbi:hypothetical protein K438DRAFT_1762873 [Mycena galopus ATCC 62051]|nr:hypothetical protein K438DRAFT_1762873 [Mycena galopus ATCC 62051]
MIGERPGVRKNASPERMQERRLVREKKVRQEKRHPIARWRETSEIRTEKGRNKEENERHIPSQAKDRTETVRVQLAACKGSNGGDGNEVVMRGYMSDLKAEIKNIRNKRERTHFRMMRDIEHDHQECELGKREIDADTNIGAAGRMEILDAKKGEEKGRAKQPRIKITKTFEGERAAPEEQTLAPGQERGEAVGSGHASGQPLNSVRAMPLPKWCKSNNGVVCRTSEEETGEGEVKAHCRYNRGDEAKPKPST